MQVYNQIKIIQNGTNVGSRISDAMDVLANQGVCTLAQMSYDSGDCATQPTTIQRQAAALHKNILSNGHGYMIVSGVSQIKQRLLNGDLVVVIMPVYGVDSQNNQLLNIDYTNKVYQSKSGSIIGYHAVCLVGYDDSLQAFKFINSWGVWWGLKGYGYVSYNNMIYDGNNNYNTGYIMADLQESQQKAQWRFTEGSGTTAADNSGNGNVLTLGSSASWSTHGYSGSCLSLSGTSNSNAQSGTTLGNFGTTDFAISARIKTSVSNSVYEMICGKRGTSGDGSFFDLFIGNGVFQMEIDQDANATNHMVLTGIRKVNDGNWHMVTAVRSGNRINLYVDGLLDVTGTTSSATNINNSTAFTVGYIPPFSTYYFNGLIDELTINNIALDPSTIYNIYASPETRWSFYNGDLTNTDSTWNNLVFTANGMSYYGYDPSFKGGFLLFGGSSDYNNQLNDTNYGNFATDNFTINVWLSPPATSSAAQIIYGKRATSGDGSFYDLYIQNGTIHAEIDQDANATNHLLIHGTKNIADNKWHMVTFVRNGPTISTYIDGVLDTSGTTATTANFSNTASFTLGYISPISNYYYLGGLDELSSYKRALSSVEIRNMYNNIVSNWKLDEGANTNSADLVSSGNTLTLASSATWLTQGYSGCCLCLSGSANSYAQVTDPNFGNTGNNDFSINAWIKTSVSDATSEIIWGKRSTDSSKAYYTLSVNNGVLYYDGQLANGFSHFTYDGTTKINDGKWHLVTLKLSQSYITGYIDSSQEFTGNAGINLINDAPLTFGYVPALSTSYFNGLLDEISVYNSGITTSQIANIYSIPSTYWTLDDGNGVAAIDTINTNNTLTIGSAAVWSTQGYSGSCLGLSGVVNSNAQVNNTSFGNFGTGDFTISARIKTSVSGSVSEFICGKRATSGDGSFYDLFVGSGLLKAEVDQDANATNHLIVSGTHTINDGNWRLVTLTRSGTSVKLYVDGVLDGSGSTTTTANFSNTAPFTLGYTPPFSTYYYSGMIDDVKIYNRALAATEITSL